MRPDCGAIPSSGRTVNTYSADRARMESDLQMQSRLVRMLARGLGPTAEIVRLDQDKVYQLDLRKKRYVETSLAEHRARLQQAMQQARDAQARQQQAEQAQRPGGASSVDAAQREWGEPKAEVLRSGEKATIADLSAERVAIDARQSCRDRATGQVCEYQMLVDQWVAPGASAGEAAIRFQRAYARQMGYAAPLSEGVAQRAEGQFGRYGQMWQAAAKELGDLKGYPVRSRFTLALGGPQCGTTNGGSANAQDGARGASPSPSPLGGLAGQLGGLLKRRKSEPSTAAPADGAPVPETGAGLVRLMTLTSRSSRSATSRRPRAPTRCPLDSAAPRRRDPNGPPAGARYATRRRGACCDARSSAGQHPARLRQAMSRDPSPRPGAQHQGHAHEVHRRPFTRRLVEAFGIDSEGRGEEETIPGIVVGEGDHVGEHQCDEGAEQQPATIRTRPVRDECAQREHLHGGREHPEQMGWGRPGHEQPAMLEPRRAAPKVRREHDRVIERRTQQDSRTEQREIDDDLPQHDAPCGPCNPIRPAGWSVDPARTPAHFLPLAHVAGLCAAARETARPFAEGQTLGSLSMTSYLVGMARPSTTARGAREQTLPAHLSPEDTNI